MNVEVPEDDGKESTDPDTVLRNAPFPQFPPEQGAVLAQEARLLKFASAQDRWTHLIKSGRSMTMADWTPVGVPADTLNIWTGNMQLILEGTVLLRHLKPVRTFEAYVEKKYGYDPALLSYVMEKSDKALVAEIDRIGSEFNKDLARIKKEGDINSALETARTIFRLIKGMEPDF
jgi:hypothetical protein